MWTDGWTGVCACHRERYDFFTDGFADRRHICVTDMWGGGGGVGTINADTIGTYQSYLFQGFELFKMCCLSP